MNTNPNLGNMPSVVASAKTQKIVPGKNEKSNGHRNGSSVKPNGSARHAPTHDEIARRAYEIYEADGCQPGRDVEYWLRAEAELT